MTDQRESPWFCPDCEHWVGWKRRQCSCGRREPRFPLRHEDVAVDQAWRVTRRHRLLAKLRGARRCLGNTEGGR